MTARETFGTTTLQEAHVLRDDAKSLRQLLDHPTNWVQGQDYTQDGRRCLRGAIRTVAHMGKTVFNAETVMFTDMAYLRLMELVSYGVYGGGGGNIVAWNDWVQRTHADIICVLDRAVALADALVNDYIVQSAGAGRDEGIDPVVLQSPRSQDHYATGQSPLARVEQVVRVHRAAVDVLYGYGTPALSNSYQSDLCVPASCVSAEPPAPHREAGLGQAVACPA